MEVLSSYFDVKTTKTLSNFKIIGLSLDSNFIIRYEIEGKHSYINHSPDGRLGRYLFYEILNNSPLWSIEFQTKKLEDNYYSKAAVRIQYRISMEINLIHDFINSSMALNIIMADYYKGTTTDYDNPDLSTSSILPYCEAVKTPSDFKIPLYEYQRKTLAKMLQIENHQTDFSIEYSRKINIKGTEILFDPITCSRVFTQSKFKVETCGGVLSDEMGLGKTISSIALITANPAPVNIPKFKLSTVINNDIEKICSKATIVLCPSHLTKQWESEVKKANPSLKVKTILTKNDYKGLLFSDFINNDVIITSHQFIMNFNFYPTLYYGDCTASSFNFETRAKMIKEFINKNRQKMSYEELLALPNPIFEFFYFQRLILDEGHEIFGEMLGNYRMSQYMSQWVSNIDANYFWYVSGTPFVNFTGIKNCARFIRLKLQDQTGVDFDFGSNTNNNAYLTYDSSSRTISFSGFLKKEYIWSALLDKICIRHRKVDVENQIKIPGHTEKLIWLEFTELEKQLYEAKKGKVTDQYLQQLCCHPLVVDSIKKIFDGAEVDLAVMQDKLISHHKESIITNTKKLNGLDITNQAYHMLKKMYETQISESKYLVSILEKMKEPPKEEDNNDCSICMDSLTNPTLTACGHIFCYDCLKMCLGDKKRCPMCKADLTGKDLLVVNKKVEPKKGPVNQLIEKYGSKLGKLISIIRFLVAQEDTRIIMFSQWDDMLSLVSKTLIENGIGNVSVKGNSFCRNAAIRKFKAGKGTDGDDNKVIMLSLKNAASGTNLTEASHIFFIEPIDAPSEECKAIEGQAIARACRIGQKNAVQVTRVLIGNTIEEAIYRKSYNKNVVVNIDTVDEYVVPEKQDSETKEEVSKKEEPKKKRTYKKKAVINVEPGDIVV